MTYFLFRDEDGGWRWRAVAPGLGVVAEAADSYPTAASCRRAVRVVMAECPPRPGPIPSWYERVALLVAWVRLAGELLGMIGC